MNLEKMRIRLAEIQDEISILENERGDLISLAGKINARMINIGPRQ